MSDQYDPHDEETEGQMAEDEMSEDFANFDAKRYLRKRGYYTGESRDELEQGIGRRFRSRSGFGEDEEDDRNYPVGGSRSRRYRAGSSSGVRRGRTARGDLAEDSRGELFRMIGAFLIEPGMRAIILGLGCFALALIGGCALLVVLLLRR